MRKVIVQTQVSLDGVQENPQLFVFDYFSDEIMSYNKELLFQSDALLAGRVTYEGFAEVWPTRTGDDFSDRINSLPKYVGRCKDHSRGVQVCLTVMLPQQLPNSRRSQVKTFCNTASVN
jgi:dihydrofolate reductase